MKKLSRIVMVPFLIVLFVLGSLGSGAALAQDDQGLTVILKIYRLEQIFDLLDQVARDETATGTALPTAMIRGMLQGTAWIDDNRAIVLGVDTSGPDPVATVLIPFLETNAKFKNSFKAEQGPDYYLVGLPPGKAVEITPENRKILEETSTQSAQGLVGLQVALAQLIRQNKDRIAQQMLRLETMPSRSQPGPHPIQPSELKELLQGIVQIAEQIDKLSFTLDADKDNLTWIFEAQAVDQTDVAAVFSSAAESWRMAGLEPKGQIQFSSRAFDLEGLLNLFVPLMEPLYRPNDMPFRELISIAKSFTGEMAGAVSFAGDRVEAEMVTVLKDKVSAGSFIEDVYLPWLSRYMESLRELLERQGLNPDGKLWHRTTDSRVKGLPVYGLEIRMPLMPAVGAKRSNGYEPKMMSYPMRMAVVEDMFLSAPDDLRLAKLISRVKKARKVTAPPWLARYSVDSGAYLQSITDVLPFKDQLPDLPTGLGRIVSHVTASGGKIVSKTAIAIKDIKAIAAFFREMAQAAKSASTAPASPEAGKKNIGSKPRAVKKPVTPAEMVDKGNLLATYGNYQGAVEYYLKAISRQPGLSAAYFNLGLAYGELEKYDQALKALDKAIELMPDKAVYYYGRGRVLLMAGHQEQARKDFEKAASLGDEDARRYLATQAEN